MVQVSTPEPPETIVSPICEASRESIRWKLVFAASLYLLVEYFALTLGSKLGFQGIPAQIIGASASTGWFLFAYWWNKDLKLDLGFRWQHKPRALMVSLCCVFGMGIFGLIEGYRSPLLLLGIRDFFFTGITAPVLEELAYRGLAFGLLCHAFGSRGYLWPVLITTVCFGLAHAFRLENGLLIFLVPKFTKILLTGLVYGFVRAYSGSLVFPILCHFVGNTAILLVIYFKALS